VWGTLPPLLVRWVDWLSWSENVVIPMDEYTFSCMLVSRSVPYTNARVMEAVRPVICFIVRIIAEMQIYRDLATCVWAAITWCANLTPTKHVWRWHAKQKLWAVDHSARVSRKSKANFVIYCELQNALIINLSNAHCGYWLTVAPFVWGSVVSSIVTFVSGGLWGVMILMSCVENCVWRLIKVSLLWKARSMC
jgi:hypothetical protein